MPSSGCTPGDLVCGLGQSVAKGATNGGMNALSDGSNTFFGKMAKGLATAWMNVPEPVLLTKGANTAAVKQYGGSLLKAPTGASDSLQTLLNWGAFVAIVVGVGALMVLGVALFMRSRSDVWAQFASKWIPWLVAIGLVMNAGSLATLVAKPTIDSHLATPLYFLQSNTSWLLVALVAIGIVCSSIAMIVQQRGEPAQQLVLSLLKLAFVSAAGTAVVTLIMSGFDSWSNTLMYQASNCKNGDAACFGDTMTKLITLASEDAMGQIGIVIMGIIGGIILVIQVALFLIRSALLPLMVGLLPLGYAAALIPGGKSTASKLTAWTIAFLLYKPAAAVIYSFAMVTVGQNTTNNLDVLFKMIYGFILVVAAGIALPALIRLITPAAGAVAGGAGAGAMLGLAAGAAIEAGGSAASGAIRNGWGGGGGGGGGNSSSSGPESSASSPSGAKPSGQTSAASQPASSTGSTAASGATEGAGAAAGAGAAGGSAATGAAAAGAGAATGGASIAATAAVEAGKHVAQGAAGAMQDATSGPSGSEESK